MKLKFYLITIALLFVAFGAKAEGDEVITIHTNNSETTKIAIADISKIVFETSELNIINNSGISNYFNYSDVRKLTFDEGLSVESITATDSDVTIFPNPVKENLTINGAENMFGADLYIYSITGTLVTKHANWNGENINVSSLNPGIYFINFNSTTIKFVKQ